MPTNDLQYPSPTDSNGNPFVGAIDPATGHAHPLEGGTTTSITGSPTSATSIRLVTETKDGGSTAIGATTDTAYTSGSGSLVSLLKGLFAKLASVVSNTSAFTDGTTSGTVTNTNDVVSLALPGGQATALAQITGTWSGTLTFEASADGGTTWVATSASSGSVVSTTATANGNWRANVAGYTNFRVRLSTATSGTASLRINLSAQPHNIVANNAMTLGQATMTGSAPVVLASDQSALTVAQGNGAAAGTAWRIEPDFAEVTSNASGVTSGNTDLIGSIDVSRYRHFSLQIVGTFNSCVFTVQGSNDNTNFVGVLTQNPAVSAANFQTISSTGIYDAATTFRYLRVRCTTFGTAPSGMTATLELYTTAAPVKALSVAEAGTWTVQPGNTANTTPWVVNANAGTNLNTSLLALESGGNLATLAGAVSSSKVATKAASGDFADGSLVTVGTEADAAYTSGSGTLISILKGLFGRTPALGQTTMSASSPVAIASDQTNVPANIKQVNGSSISLGQAAMASSLPVAIASDQSSVTVTQGSSAAAGTRWRTGGDFVEIAGAGTGTVNGINTDFIPSTDVSSYKWLSLHLTGTFSLTLSFQGSNDNSNFVSVNLSSLISPVAINTGTATGGTNAIWAGPINFRYFRVRATSFTSNASLAGNLELYTQAPAFPLIQYQTPSTTTTSSAGSTDFHLVSANTTNANNVKASAGLLYGYELGNGGASDAWVKFYNTSGTPTAGSGTPIRVVYVPKGQRVAFHSTTGIACSSGIGLTITGGAADSDTTAVATSQVTVEVDYK